MASTQASSYSPIQAWRDISAADLLGELPRVGHPLAGAQDCDDAIDPVTGGPKVPWFTEEEQEDGWMVIEALLRNLEKELVVDVSSRDEFLKLYPSLSTESFKQVCFDPKEPLDSDLSEMASEYFFQLSQLYWEIFGTEGATKTYHREDIKKLFRRASDLWMSTICGPEEDEGSSEYIYIAQNYIHSLVQKLREHEHPDVFLETVFSFTGSEMYGSQYLLLAVNATLTSLGALEVVSAAMDRPKDARKFAVQTDMFPQKVCADLANLNNWFLSCAEEPSQEIKNENTIYGGTEEVEEEAPVKSEK